MQKNNEYNGKNQEIIRIVRALILGIAVGAAVCAAFLSLAAMALVKAGTLPIEALPLLTTAIGAIGSFFAGYFTVTAYKKRGLLLGCIAGALLFFIVFVTGVTHSNNGDLINTLTKCIIFTVAGGIGGVVRVNKKTKVKKY